MGLSSLLRIARFDAAYEKNYLHSEVPRDWGNWLLRYD